MILVRDGSTSHRNPLQGVNEYYKRGNRRDVSSLCQQILDNRDCVLTRQFAMLAILLQSKLLRARELRMRAEYELRLAVCY